MKNRLPQKYTCPKCNRTSSSKGYYCPFCGHKKEKPDSQFIEYDFDLFPQSVKTANFKNKQKPEYVKKVIISFSLIAFIGLAFYLPYTTTKRLMQKTKPEILQIDVTPKNNFKTIPFTPLNDINSTTLNSTNNAQFIENNFDIYYESNQLYNINQYFKDLVPNITNKVTQMTLDTILAQTDGNITVAIKDNDFVIVLKFQNRDFVYTLEKILKESEYKTSVVDDYLIVSNSKSFLERNIESYKGTIKNLAKSGYFKDTINALPSKGQVFIFIKTIKGLNFFKQTMKIPSPSEKLPVGIIIDDDKLNYIDFTF